jgi:PAP2 superfamily
MPNLELSWPQAAIAAAAVALLTVGLRLARRPRLTATATFTQETALVLALFALWQFAGSFAVMGPDGALARGRWLWHLERAAHLPSETSVQRLFLPHPLLVQAFNLYYDTLHFPVLIGCLIWLFVKHRDRYSPLRITLVALTGACLLIQLIPVAPPRMLPGTGLVDTAVLYHQSVYATHAGFEPDQLSAMPSVHVGWAILVAVMIITVARSPWRWLALLYPALTTLAVVVTANHYWMDGIVAGLLLAAVLLIQSAVTRLAARYAPARRIRHRAAWDQPDKERASVSEDAPSRNAASAAGLSSMRQS